MKVFLKLLMIFICLEDLKNKIVSMPGFGKKSYDKLIQAIEKSRKVKLENLLYALGINQVGLGGSRRLSKHFNGDFQLFLLACERGFDFSQLIDFGEITSRSIHSWYNDENETKMWLDLGNEIEFIKPEEKQVVTNNNPFNGKKVYATGSFANYKKEEIKQVLESLGATFASGYAKSLDYLIEGSLKSSSKVDKAKKDGIPVMTEEEFIEMIN